MNRDWSLARRKVEQEGRCRVCNLNVFLEAAHIIPRSLGGSPQPVVDPDEIVPLCRHHHREYDEYLLDLLPYLTKGEQAAAVLKVGLITALRIVTSESRPRNPTRGWVA